MTSARPYARVSSLAKWSPLIALAAACLIVFTLPVYMIPFMFDFRAMAAQGVTPQMRGQWMESIAAMDAGESANLIGGEDSLDALAAESWTLIARGQDAYVTTAGVEPLALAPDDVMFAPMAAYERATGAKVWAWTLLDTGVPPVAARAIGSPATLEAMEREIESMNAVIEPGTRPITDVTERFWFSDGVAGAMVPVNSQSFETNGGMGLGGEGYSTWSTTVRQAGALWFITAIVEPGNLDEPGSWTPPTELADLDPRSPEYRERADRIARRDNMNLFVLGPLTTDVVPLRAPEGDGLSAEELGEALWPAIAGRANTYGVNSITDLTERESSLAGGAAAAYTVKSIWNSPPAQGSWFDYPGIQPQTVLFVAVFDESPIKAPGPLLRSWRSWQRLVAMYFPYWAGGAFGLVFLSLIASPTAFVLERRRIARERMASELERMRRDAHDKVYNRLSALSKRVATAGDEATEEFTASLGTIAADIRGTVGELQGILGEQVHHTDASLGNQSLADQLESVCIAQAARLGVRVTFDPAPGIPAVSPGLGWDLQCVTEEAITNAVRHGAATEITVTIDQDSPGELTLSVADNGSGSAVVDASGGPSGSTGLAGMKARLEQRDGTLELSSDATGTVVIARGPVD